MCCVSMKKIVLFFNLCEPSLKLSGPFQSSNFTSSESLNNIKAIYYQGLFVCGRLRLEGPT